MLKYFKDYHNLKYTPAGLWAWDEDLEKKTKIDANRVDNLQWDDHPDDNMGRTKTTERDTRTRH